MAVGITTKWYGDKFLDKLKAHEANNLKRAAIYLRNEVVKTLGTRSGPCNDRANRQAKSSEGKKTRRSEKEYKRSKAGDTPHLMCGHLRRSIAWEVDTAAMVARVGSNLVYARYLELGTSKMAARPYLKPALYKNGSAIHKILATRMI